MTEIKATQVSAAEMLALLRCGAPAIPCERWRTEAAALIDYFVSRGLDSRDSAVVMALTIAGYSTAGGSLDDFITILRAFKRTTDMVANERRRD
jgi:hypothetical protein